MSQEEQDAILGRTVREYSELQRSLALIDAELGSLADDLGKLVGFVNGHIRLSRLPSDAKRPIFPERISKYLDTAKLTALLEEQKQLLSRIRSTSQVLTDLKQ